MKFYEINILCPTKICDFIIFHPLLKLKRWGSLRVPMNFLGIVPMGPSRPFLDQHVMHGVP